MWDSIETASKKQKDYIKKLEISIYGFSITDIEKLTKSEASSIIEKLVKKRDELKDSDKA